MGEMIMIGSFILVLLLMLMTNIYTIVSIFKPRGEKKEIIVNPAIRDTFILTIAFHVLNIIQAVYNSSVQNISTSGSIRLTSYLLFQLSISYNCF